MSKEPFIKCCGECKWWSGPKFQRCDAPLAPIVKLLPSAVVEGGQGCPCFKDWLCEY